MDLQHSSANHRSNRSRDRLAGQVPAEIRVPGRGRNPRMDRPEFGHVAAGCRLQSRKVREVREDAAERQCERIRPVPD